MKTLYLECSSGISGDMTVGALLDLGASEEKLKAALSSFKDESFRIEISRVKKSEIDCCDFNVILDEAHENHDHDLEYLYGNAHVNGHNDGNMHEAAHVHGGSGEHSHEDNDPKHAHSHEHHHRNLNDIKTIIGSLDLTRKARELAIRIFTIIAEAEAKAHGKPVDEVHFHEVGAIDSIVDVVAASVCFDDLEIDEVIVPKICEGTGTVRCRHGILPVPVPAVLNIAEMYKLPLSIMDRPGEYVTPTGAAFVAAVMTSSVLPETMIPKKTGLGAGKREHELPGILRAIII